MKKTGIALLFLLLGLIMPSNAEIYLYVDSDGVIQPHQKRQASPNQNTANLTVNGSWDREEGASVVEVAKRV